MLLEATQVAIERGDRTLLSCVDLSVAGGEIWQLVGANGVGKTSLLRGLAGVARLGVTGEIRHGSTFLYLGHASGHLGFCGWRWQVYDRRLMVLTCISATSAS